MKTETLNEYIFASLVRPFATAARVARMDKMIAEGVSQGIAYAAPMTTDDYKIALHRFESERKEILSLLSEVRPDLFESPPDDH